MRIAALVILAVALAGCGAPPPTKEVVRPVQLTQVAIGATGSAAVFAGVVAPRHEADVGARVKKGQVVARLDPADVGLQAEAAKAQVAATETEFRFAQAEFQRYQNLFNEKFISASAPSGMSFSTSASSSADDIRGPYPSSRR